MRTQLALVVSFGLSLGIGTASADFKFTRDTLKGTTKAAADFKLSHEFDVAIDGEVVARPPGFVNRDGSLASEIIETLDGGNDVATFRPGRSKPGSLTISKDWSNTAPFRVWRKAVIDGVTKRKSVSIVMLNDAGTEAMRLDLQGAIPKVAPADAEPDQDDGLVLTFESDALTILSPDQSGIAITVYRHVQQDSVPLFLDGVAAGDALGGFTIAQPFVAVETAIDGAPRPTATGEAFFSVDDIGAAAFQAWYQSVPPGTRTVTLQAKIDDISTISLVGAAPAGTTGALNDRSSGHATESLRLVFERMDLK